MMTMTTTVGFWGGPADGDERRLDLPLDPFLSEPGHCFVEKDSEGNVVRRGQFHYQYALAYTKVPFGRRYLYVFQHDDIVEGGDEMSLRKHGTGQILNEDGDAVSKTASSNEWSDQDEGDLADETEKE
jgi:hypothetical protein